MAIFSLLLKIPTDVMITMIVIWSVVLAGTLLIEFLSCDMTSVWFSVGAVAALCFFWLDWHFQALIFFAVSFAFLAALRPVTRELIRTKSVPTNADSNIGKKYKLLKDVVDNRSQIKIDDVIWTVATEEQLKEGDTVEIMAIEGNKFIVTGDLG